MQFLAILWRFVVLAFSLAVSTAVVTVVGLQAFRPFLEAAGPGFAEMDPGAATDFLIRFLVLVGTTAAAALHAFVPWVILVLASEFLCWRSLFAHLGLGVAVALVAALMSGAALVPTAVQILVALGLVGGFVHWLIAGRNAGRWSEGTLTPRSNDVPPQS